MADTKEQGRTAADNATRTVTGQAGRVMNAAAGVADTVRHSAETAMNAATGLVGEAKDKLQGLTSDASNMARQATDKAQEWAGEALECTTTTMKNFGSEVTDVVKRYPIQSLLVGFGIGLLIGRTVRST